MRLRIALTGLVSLMCLQANANIVLMHVFNFDFGATPPTHSDPVIEVGDTVRWIFDIGIHSTTAAAGQTESWNSTLVGFGSTFDHTFTTVGSFNYFCGLHGFDLGGGQVGGMSGHVTVANTYLPSSFSIFRGKLISGGLSDALTSDDQYLIIGKGIVQNLQQAAIQVNFTTTIPNLNPTVLAVSVEDGSNAAGLTRRLEMMNVVTNQFEQVAQGPMQIPDKITVFNLTGTLSRFVDQSTGAVTVRISYPALGPVSIIGYQAKFDRVAFLSN